MIIFVCMVSKSAQKELDKTDWIDDKERYTIQDHTGQTQIITGKELRLYIVAHRHFIQPNLEQQVSELTNHALKNKN